MIREAYSNIEDILQDSLSRRLTGTDFEKVNSIFFKSLSNINQYITGFSFIPMDSDQDKLWELLILHKDCTFDLSDGKTKLLISPRKLLKIDLVPRPTFSDEWVDLIDAVERRNLSEEIEKNIFPIK
jgi:hypothetical protein